VPTTDLGDASSLRALTRLISTRTFPVAKPYTAPRRDVDGIRTRHDRVCRDASRIHEYAAEFVAFDNRDGPPAAANRAVSAGPAWPVPTMIAS
jgi:hypothetical protein